MGSVSLACPALAQAPDATSTAASAHAPSTISSVASALRIIDEASGRVLPCIALREEIVDPLTGFVDPVLVRVLPCVALMAMEESPAADAQILPVLRPPNLLHLQADGSFGASVPSSLSKRLGPAAASCPSYADVVTSAGPPSVPRVKMVGGIIPGVAHRRPATSTCSVVSTPKMEDEAYRLRTMALLLTVMGPCSGITADMVAEVVEQAGFPRDIMVWRFYCRVAIEGLPLNAWSWDNVQEVIGKKCRLDLIERQSTTKTNVSALFAWLWAWDPNLIPRASDFNVISRRDVARSRRSLPEGTPSEQGREGPHFPVLIHLDVVKDYTPVEDEDLEWPRIYEHKDWKMGSKDGERRARAAVSDGYAPPARRNDDDADDRYNGGARRRGKRSGACDGFWQGMRDRANRRDATVRAPAPRRYTRHDGAAALKARVLGPPTVAKQLLATVEEAPAALQLVAATEEPTAVHQ
ncbi:hypothetical protein ZWY2020_008444 [Hordeum vulgare]|nr:hypothetical protein ZWY2020_008444 [Hordeum vulgare]